MSAVQQAVSAFKASGGAPSNGLLANLVSYWKMDEASGNALDAHGSNTLTDNNSVGTGTGKINGARQFNTASSRYLSHTDNASLSTGDIDFTFSVWVKLDSKGAYRILVSQIDATSFGYQVYYEPGADRFIFDVFNGAMTIIGSVTASTLGSPSTGTWYHIVVWHDAAGNFLNIQINGGSVDTAGTTAGAGDSSAEFRIGARAYATSELYHDGLIDEVGFWKEALNSTKRGLLYGGGSGLPYSSFS